MKSRLILAAAMLLMLGACVVGPYEGPGAYGNGGYDNGYYRNYAYGHDTYYDGRYDSDAHNRTFNNGRAFQ
jgi:hypothetical protein